MQVVKYKYNEVAEEAAVRVSDKEVMLLSEIGLDQIPTATEFVEYIAGTYGMSQSGIWYTLKRLKEKGMLNFTEKGEGYRPLALTEVGIGVLRENMGSEGANQYVMPRMAQISA